MKTITLKQAKEIDFNRASVALGTFDGLHRGHNALIQAALSHVGDTVAFTFDTLPINVFKKQQRPMQLFTMKEKIVAFSKTGIDYLCVAHFDKDFAGLTRDDFERLIIDTFNPDNIIAGYNYTFGKNAEGTAEVLLQDVDKLGCNVEVIPKVLVNGKDVSSTKIRKFLWEGNIKNANELLGYQYFINGVVLQYIDKNLKDTTVRIGIPQKKAAPRNGTYRTMVKVGESFCDAVCNVGTDSAINENRTIEVVTQDLIKDITDEPVTVVFKERLRD